ncbi:hypothetical protein ACIBSV_13485 [Embleya sp. NPDC050154]|uniref:hypothetical protein n=1 Tax=unclassified Embleya TaxID=2699296 RepID=UPI0037953F1F|nr:hypothetical protein OG948_10850 [Embleya sp. NBC_00888]
MQLGLVVLYILFVPIGLWLLTEVLWQHGAPFRYRVLAFVGFVGVAAGVGIKNPVLVGIGVFCFAVGQFLTTRYVRKAYHHGWTVSGRRPKGRRAKAR